ncbi:Fe-S cluster assembly sulfur transfer protein SufU [uncultured Eubacterium sp.]|uniref:Fe-S cluster assembly sulfur transfer protein SufU n=1 Tax=uncultured Eubacterium sp. TaxID=165185 RepID=UPI0025955C24|nr:SUF system NifU family Fe-S cluster assembly protein [uncultured Eubacterium sp.]
MDNKNFYNRILTEHNISPFNKGKLTNPMMVKRGVNPSCGDDLTIELNVDDGGIIKECAYTGDGCAISQASCDIMIDLVVGKSVDEALRLKEIFLRMIKEEINEEEEDELGEAIAFADVAHMPARVKCAVLGWRTLEEILK